jgi:two-component system cell cycle response regulator DivK
MMAGTVDARLAVGTMPATVLIVENDDAARLGLTALLERAGYSVLAAATFKEGRRILREIGADLLIVDVRLDDYNGLQLVAATSEVPAIVITGVSDPVIEQDARKLHADFLLKPVSPADLLALVAKKLKEAPECKGLPATRRWTRKSVTRHVGARVDGSRARVIDVSYGGLRLEVESDAAKPLPQTFQVSLPDADLTLPVDLVWSDEWSAGTRRCGVALSQIDPPAAHVWYCLVDSVA